MAGETVITIVGNLTSDPGLRYTQNGLAVANFTIASTPRTFDRTKNEWVDGEALFLRASVWREFAEHVAASLVKGARVIVQGRLKQTSWTDKDTGQNRTGYALEVDEIGPSLRYATAQVTKAKRDEAPWGGQPQGQPGQNWGGQPAGGGSPEPWGQPAAGGPPAAPAPSGGQQAQGGWQTSQPAAYNDETPF